MSSPLTEVAAGTGRAALWARERQRRERAAEGIVPPQFGWGRFRWVDAERARQDEDFPRIVGLLRAVRLDPPPATCCQWIDRQAKRVGDLPSFCNKPVVRGAYCGAHAAVCFLATAADEVPDSASL